MRSVIQPCHVSCTNEAALFLISTVWAVQARMDAFRARFPAATEHGIGICTMKRCTHPFLLAAGLAPGEAQTDAETWGPALQEVALPVPLSAGAPLVVTFLTPARDACALVSGYHRGRVWV